MKKIILILIILITFNILYSQGLDRKADGHMGYYDSSNKLIFEYSNYYFQGRRSGSGGWISNWVSSSTFPTVGPTMYDKGMGLGWGGVDHLSFDINWIEEMYLTDLGLYITDNIFMEDDNYIGIDGAERIIFDTAGDIEIMDANVGIGTQSPDYLFHIEGSSAIGKIKRMNSDAANRAPSFLMSRTRATGANIVANDWLGKFQFFGMTAGTESEYGGLTFIAEDTSGAGRLFFGLGATEWIVFKTGGDFGIGTSTPDEKFEIEWAANVDVEIGRGTTDTDVTFITLRSNDGSKWYIVVADDGTISAQAAKP